MEVYNVVTNSFVMELVKKSKYFRKSLGLVSTVDKGLNRAYNDRDKFAFSYQNTYNTSIFGQGNLGNIKFYVDHYINDPVIAIYIGQNFEEFVFKIDLPMIKEKSIDFYLGHILKEADKQYEERAKENSLKMAEPEKIGDPDKITKNPGAVTWADVKAYMEAQNQQRFKKN